MRNLIDFIIKHSHWLVFIFLFIISLSMLVSYNPYQKSQFFSTANGVVASTLAVEDLVTEYLGLRRENNDLVAENNELYNELLLKNELLRQYKETAIDSTQHIDTLFATYKCIAARVVNNSISQLHNYITINKGTGDGINTEMGVVSTAGVVGVVGAVSEHFAVVIPILNPKFRLSCMVAKSDYFGSLIWDNRSPRYAVLEQLPSHAVIALGDTIITSGYSALFPMGVPVGYVKENKSTPNQNFKEVRIQLATNFSNLREVTVISNNRRVEQREIEQQLADTHN